MTTLLQHRDAAATARLLPLVLVCMSFASAAQTAVPSAIVAPEKFALAHSDLTIQQLALPHNPFSVAGETGAILGQQDGSFELWAFPVKVLSRLSYHRRTGRLPGADRRERSCCDIRSRA